MSGVDLTRRGMAGGVAAVAAVLAAPRFAAAEAVEAEAFVNMVTARLRAIIDEGDGGAIGAGKFLTLLEETSAISAVGRFVMGRAWREMTETQQADYQTAFRSYISRTYQNRFSEYAGEDIRITGSLDAGKKGVLVTSLLIRPADEDISVEWLISDRSGGLQISDVVFEGVSLAITLRETFGGMLESRDGDVDRFIADLAASEGA